MLKTKQGTVILLNGTSSAGKSTILKAFQTLCSDYMILKVDDWFPAELNAKATELGWQEDSGIDPWLYLYDYMVQKTGDYYFATELRQELFARSSDFYQKAKDAALQGKNVIIDTVLEYEQEYDEFFEFFKNFNVIKILVYCPLDVLLCRVEERNALGIPEQMRTAFQSFEQFPALFKISAFVQGSSGRQNNQQELVVDRVKSVVIKNALQRSIQDLIESNIPEAYLPKLEKFKMHFIEQFKLDEQKEIILTPKHQYDLILNSGTSLPQDLAKQLLEKIK